MRLGERLLRIKEIVPACNCVADIGCDHGYLSIDLLRDNIASKAILTDIAKDSCEKAIKNIKRAKLSDRAEVICADGLPTNIQEPVDVAIISGLGGFTIIGIISRSIDRFKNMKSIIVEPQSDEEAVRRFLLDNHFDIEYEDMIVEKNKYYPIIKCKLSANVDNYEDFEYKYGKLLIKNKNQVLLAKLRKDVGVLEEIIVKKDLPENERTELVRKQESIIKVINKYEV